MGKTVSLDIETFCLLEELTEEDLSYLKGRKDYESEEDFHRDLATNPYVSFLVSFSLFFLEESKGYVFYMDEEDRKEESNTTVGERNVEVLYTSISLKDGFLSAERRLLGFLWEHLRHADTLITFHGKYFDMEFIKIRTIIQGMKPTAFYKHLYSKGISHIDLKDVFKVGRNNYSLNFIARRLNLPIDKGNMDGSKIRDAFLKREYRRVADYNLRDALITGMLYERVRGYLYREPTVDLVKSAGFSNGRELIEYALDNNLLSGRETSMLIDICKEKTDSGPTERQVAYLRDLVKNSDLDLRDVCGLLSYETIDKIIKLSEEEEIT